MVVGVAGECDDELVFVDDGVAGFLDDELDGVAGGFGGEVEGEGAVGFGGCGVGTGGGGYCDIGHGRAADFVEEDEAFEGGGRDDLGGGEREQGDG